MRSFMCCTILLLVCALTQVQGNAKTLPNSQRACIKMTHHEDGSFSAVGCPLMQCREQIGYRKEDLSKPYPECCGRPICKDT